MRWPDSDREPAHSQRGACELQIEPCGDPVQCAKYSGCSHASISIYYEGGYLTMKVTDNGKGFDNSKQQMGNGLRNMKRRADMLQATLKIESTNQGTTVFLRTKTK